MEIERIQCTVRLFQNGKTELTTVVKAGPDALAATEIPIMRLDNDVADGLSLAECCIREAQVVGTFETTQAAEFERLKLKYGEKRVRAVYPQARLMPKTLAECDLPDGCARPVKREKKPDTKSEMKRLKKMLEDAGVTDLPLGDLSLDDLQALAAERGLMELDA